MESNVNFKYYAFISYSHEDTEFAQLIQKKLTEYKLPSVIRKANPLLPGNVRPIFRDATNLTTGKLKETLHSELEHSKFLIVLCSPNSARPNDENKHWVNNEVQHFIELGRSESIIPVIVGGEPHAANPEEECFCPALLSLPGGDELLGIDIRSGKKKSLSFGRALKRKLGIPDEDDLEEKATVHIVAKMLGLGVDDLWGWDKKARKRKAYARLFSAATIFVCMLMAGTVIYFRKFHVYHEYYVDFVEKAVKKNLGVDIEYIGLGKLTKKEIQGRYRHYKFDCQDGKLRRIVYENSAGVPQNMERTDMFNGVKILEPEYNESTGLLQAVISKNEYDSVLTKYVYEQNGTVVDLKNKDGSPVGLKSHTTSIRDIENSDKNVANIKSYKLERDENGYVVKIMYFKAHGAEYPAKDADGISGFEYKLDNLGRSIQVWYLGMKNSSFNRQTTKNGIAGYFLEYNADYNNSKQTFVNSDGIPTYNPSVNSGIKVCAAEYKNGNLTKQFFYDETGSLCSNSEGIAYYKIDYDSHGNITCASSYDTQKKLVCNNEGYAITRFSYDKKGNISKYSYYDADDIPCVTKDGYSARRNKYNQKNQLIESECFDQDDKPTLDDNGYVKISVSYNENGDIESMCFFDADDTPCLSSNGYAKQVFVYDENHRCIEKRFYDIDFNTPIKNAYNVARIMYEYDKLGNEIESKCFDENDNPVNDSDGIFYKKQIYDETGNLKETFYFDLNGKSAAVFSGAAGIGYTYDEFGNILSESLYEDLNKTLCDSKLGYAYIEYKYDERGNQIQKDMYNAKKEPLQPLFSYKKEYDSNNNIVHIAYYDSNDNPVKNEHGISQKKSEYDDRGRIIKESYFDESGNYALFDNSYAIATVKYDEYGRVIETACYNAQGKLWNGSAPYVIKRFKYDSRGNMIEQAFYKSLDELCVGENGCAIERLEFDAYRNIIQITVYDETRNLMNGPGGHAKIEQSFNSRRNLVSQRFYDKDLNLIKESSYDDGKIIHEVWYSAEDTAEKNYEYDDDCLIHTIYAHGKNGYEEFYNAGVLASRFINYADGRKTEELYDSNGVLSLKTLFSTNGEKEEQSYKENKLVHKIFQRLDGTSDEEFYENDELIREITHSSGGEKMDLFYKKGGLIRAIVWLLDGTKVEQFYEEDNCVHQIWYSAEGDVINEKFYDD